MANITLHNTTEGPLAALTSAARDVLVTWRMRVQQRRELATLDHRMVRDLGLSAPEIQFEANKPFWRA